MKTATAETITDSGMVILGRRLIEKFLMNRIAIVLTLLSFAFAGTVEGQIDSAPKTPDSDRPEMRKDPSRTKQSPAQSAEYKKEDREEIEIDQIPDLVRLTLEQGKQYRGWHNATIFVDRAAREYILNIEDSTAATRTFRFNEQGEDLTKELTAAEKTKKRKKPTRG